jgi:hypothetical protein
MNVDQRIWWTGAILLATTNMFPAMAPAADVVTKFRETDEMFQNPGQGWMTTRRLPDGPGRFPYSVSYFRLNWEDLEPVEGQYSWQLIDEPLEAWAKREVRIAFRIMTTNAHAKGYYCSPKWLFDAGCKSYEYVRGGADIASGGARITRIEPDYGDPLYLEKHGQFLKALAERYDGNSQIEFIDIGSYDYLVQRGWSFDRALEFMAVNHVTFINDNIGKVPPDQMPKLEQLARRAGYRFVLREISHPGSIAPGKTLGVTMKWSNVGVGKLYRRYPLVLYLLDSSGSIVCRQTQADIDPTSWLPGDQAVTATLRLPGRFQAGRYTLGVALVDQATEKPAIRLAIEAPQTDRLYHVSSIVVK